MRCKRALFLKPENCELCFSIFVQSQSHISSSQEKKNQSSCKKYKVSRLWGTALKYFLVSVTRLTHNPRTLSVNLQVSGRSENSQLWFYGLPSIKDSILKKKKKINSFHHFHHSEKKFDMYFKAIPRHSKQLDTFSFCHKIQLQYTITTILFNSQE